MAEKLAAPPPAPPPVPEPASEAKILADAIGQAIRANRPQGPLEQAGFSEAQIAALTELPKPKKWREVRCKSEETGATFTACVVESKTMVAGRIVQLKDYRHPAGASTFQRDGGLVPDGMQILRAGTSAPGGDVSNLQKHDYTPHYLQWRYEEFWQRDLNRYSGKELKQFLCATPADFSTPWEEGRVGPLVNEDAA